MPRLSRRLFLFAIIATTLSGRGISFAAPVTLSIPYSKILQGPPNAISSSEVDVALVYRKVPGDNVGRALGGPYSQPHEPDGLVGPTGAPILPPYAGSSALKTATMTHSLSWFPMPTPPSGAAAVEPHQAAMNAGGITVHTSVHATLHTLNATLGPAWRTTGTTAVQQENHRAVPTQMMIVSCVLAGVVVFTLCGCFLMNPRIWASCCGRRKEIKRPVKRQCYPPPSWMRVLPPSNSEFIASKRRNAFSIHQDTMERKDITGIEPSSSSASNLGGPSSDKFRGALTDGNSDSSQSLSGLPTHDRPSTPAFIPQLVHSVSGKPRAYISSFHRSSTFEPRPRSLYDVQEEDEDEIESMQEKKPLALYTKDGRLSCLDPFDQGCDSIVEKSRHSRALSAPIFRLWGADKSPNHAEDETHRKSMSEVTGRFRCF